MARQPTIPRGAIIGQRVDGNPADEAEHFMHCSVCGGYFDMRDLGQVFEHEAVTPFRTGQAAMSTRANG